jgi:hypothetical protein
MIPASADGGIPAYSSLELTSPRAAFAVCVFVINEGERIRIQLRTMMPLRDTVDIIVADGGSTDGSLDAEFLRSAGVTALLTKLEPGALGTQMRMAFHHCLGREYRGVICIDGNGKDGVEAIPAFAEALANGMDHVQGSRYIPGGIHRHTPALRHLGVTLLHAPLISLAAGFRYTDTTNGFRGYSRRLLTDPRVAVFRPVFKAYELHYYLAIRSARLGMRTCELPVRREYPRDGTVPTKIKGWRGPVKVLRSLFAACTGRFNPATS